MSQNLENIHHTLSKLSNALTIQEGGKLPSQPQQNLRRVNEVQAYKESSLHMREVEDVIRLRSGKQVDKPTPPPLINEEGGENSTSSKKRTTSSKESIIEIL